MARDEGDTDKRGNGSSWLSDTRRLDDSLKVLLGVLSCSCGRRLGLADNAAG